MYPEEYSLNNLLFPCLMWKTGNGSFKIFVTYLGEGEQGEQSVHGVCACMSTCLLCSFLSLFKLLNVQRNL